MLRIALMKNIVDNPDARKLQKVPVPVLGGTAVFFGIVVSMTAAGLFFDTPSYFAILGVLVIMLYVGVMDDILSLSPVMRFIVEILAVLMLIFCNDYSLNDFHGLWGIGEIPGYVAVPLTVFACVGILNAINLIDGVNGLSSGYCITACALFAVAFIWADAKAGASMAIASIGALIPFFCHNVFGSKSRMFIGDGGTLLMGMIMSIFVIGALSSGSSLAAKVP
ncbi:MAG: undecaprenyl/decaprenyl-phosphate alpha-N-acetylglucosaminyl 1-phosphate transferase, partial [Bacteroidaceae bacterium]|nr:undecaprenyl/decaprenyl-phosphate alpha-N-acetylglucosaminyl 1-phosphate transferase [Bacteroidaceae bacterium]